MRLTRKEDAPVREGRDLRSGQITFTDLLHGEDGRPDNYGLMLVDVEGGYSTPRHRHNFEQVRIMLEGSFGFGEDRVQKPGSVGYFCEGTYYTQDGRGRSRTLLLQIGGPSGQGFMSPRLLRQGIEAMKARGEIRNGVFTWRDERGGKHNQDAYEAAWEAAMGRPVRYPEPQYDAPVLLRPEKFAYLPIAGEPGVKRRHLGRFNDRGLQIGMLQLEALARHTVDAGTQTHLLYCLSGAGTVAGKDWEAGSAIEVARGETAPLVVREASEFYEVGVPVF